MSQGGVSFPPLRSLDEFAFGDAQFSSPPSDVNKWSKRVYKNLLYFQSNYFLIFSVIFLFVWYVLMNYLAIPIIFLFHICSIMYPHSIIVGAAILAGSWYFGESIVSKRYEVQNFKRKHPLLFLLGCFALVLIIFSVFGALVAFTFGVAFPLTAVFVHASTRVPGLKNKIFKMKEDLVSRSPIGCLLTSLDERLESMITND